MPNSKLNLVIVFSVNLLILLLPLAAGAQDIDPDRVLIRNVTLIDPAGKTEDTIVNILIREHKLELITEDKISRDEADQVVNAQGGVIVGKLEIGQQPSFLIFSEDPRENFQVMLDTRTYSIFAVHDGVVVKNRLLETLDEDPEEEPKKTGWLAYTPPPFAVPLNYQDTSKWNRWESKYISGIFVAGLVLDPTTEIGD